MVVCLLTRYGLRWGWPFLLAFGLSSIIRLPVDAISRKTKIPREPLAALFTLLILAAVAVGVYLLASFIFYRAMDLYDQLPGIVDNLMESLAEAETIIDQHLRTLLPILGNMPLIDLKGIIQNALSSIDYVGVFSKVSSAAGSIPSILFTSVFIIMGTYLFTVQHPDIKRFLSRNLSDNALSAIQELKDFLIHTVFRWLKAQLILTGITFCELLIILLVLQVEDAPWLSAGIALVDALPILGVGTILIPWAIVCLVTGKAQRAVGLLVGYIIILAVRNALQPRIVGQKLGMNPLVTLLGMFVGFRLGGIFGLGFLPIAILCIQHLQQIGAIRFWSVEKS